MPDDPRLAAAEFLFALLDDIDTASDIAKSDDAIYRTLVHRLNRKRFEVASTDGYSVKFHARAADGKAPAKEASAESEARSELSSAFRDEVIEECAKRIELIGLDWGVDGQYLKEAACEYLAKDLRSLKSPPSGGE